MTADTLTAERMNQLMLTLGVVGYDNLTHLLFVRWLVQTGRLNEGTPQ